jgi:hypothetical protein
MTRRESYLRCVRKEWAQDQALRRAGVTCIFVEAEPRCAMRFGLTQPERRAAWAGFGEEPVAEEVPVTTAVLQPGPAVPAVLVGISMGGLALLIGSFVSAAFTRDLGHGALVALGPSIIAGVLAAHVHRTDPALSAKIISTTTGMRVKPVVVQQPAATVTTGE